MAAVSVVIPSYNHARFLGPAIESVLGQTFTDWELAVVDDRSSDGSAGIARSYKDARIRVHDNQENLGTYATLNRAVGLGAAEFVAVLNSDDLWAPQKLERQIAALRSNPNTVLGYTYGVLVDEEGKRALQVHHLGLPREPLQNPIARLVVENRILASSVVFRRGAPAFDTTVPTSGDWVALLRLCRIGPAAYVDEPLTFWRHHGTNTSRARVAALMDEVRIRRSILSQSRTWRIPGVNSRDLRRGLSICAVRYHTAMAVVGDRREARRALMLAWRLDPIGAPVWKRAVAAALPERKLLGRILPGVDPAEAREAYRRLDVSAIQL